MSEFQDLERLLRLKRYEQPPAGHHERFLVDFKERQRGELLRQSARGLLAERISTWVWTLGPKQWWIAGGAALTTAAAAGFFLLPRSGPPPPPAVAPPSPALMQPASAGDLPGSRPR